MTQNNNLTEDTQKELLFDFWSEYKNSEDRDDVIEKYVAKLDKAIKQAEKRGEEKMISKLDKIGYDIVDNIISPICGISHVIADLHLADIDCYTVGDEKLEKKVCEEIIKKYKVKLPDWGFLLGKPLIIIALMILDEIEYVDINSLKEQ